MLYGNICVNTAYILYIIIKIIKILESELGWETCSPEVQTTSTPLATRHFDKFSPVRAIHRQEKYKGKAGWRARKSRPACLPLHAAAS